MITVQALTTEAQNKRVALEVLKTAAEQHGVMLTAWQQAMDLIWKASDPIGCVKELGTLAVTIFQVSSLTCDFLEAMSPGCTTDKLQLMAPWEITLNADGTVTITAADPPPV